MAAADGREARGRRSTFLPVSTDLVGWWDEAVARAGAAVDVFLAWGDGWSSEIRDRRLYAGRLFLHSWAFRLGPPSGLLAASGDDEEPAEGRAGKAGKRKRRFDFREFHDLLRQALTRAGWLRPRFDPSLALRLIALRGTERHVEFILDTSALVDGTAHWLIDLFADRVRMKVTPVTLRELQDNMDRLRKSRDGGKHERPDSEGGGWQGRVKSLSVALSGFRLREWPRHPVIFEELELDDTPLLLSRSGRAAAGKKSAESDTLILRAVRRAIQDRVQGLERFFVTGDTTLARRASTELPAGAVIHAKPAVVEAGDVLLPQFWWPVPEDAGDGLVGRVMRRHPTMLLWELLAMTDALWLVPVADPGRTPSIPPRARWTIKAFDRDMWPSDWRRPWVRVEEAAGPGEVVRPGGEPARGGDRPEPREPPLFEPSSVVPVARAGDRAEPAGGARDVHPLEHRRATGLEELGPDDLWGPAPTPTWTLDRNLRIGARYVLDALGRIAVAAGEGRERVALEVLPSDRTSRRHLYGLLDAAGLAGPEIGATSESVLRLRQPGAGRLARAWSGGDREGVFALLAGWKQLRDLVSTDARETRPPKSTYVVVRALARLLGQGMVWEEHWRPGGARPAPSVVHRALREAVRGRVGRAVSVRTLLLEVFLKRLGVAPSRVHDAWGRMRELGVLDGFEEREGGSPRERVELRVAELLPDGSWREVPVDLDALDTVRDIVWTRSAP